MKLVSMQDTVTDCSEFVAAVVPDTFGAAI